jgi:hypothetical protein
MIKTIARRTILRSALAAGAGLIVGHSVMSAASARQTGREGATVEARHFDHDIETLWKYAGELGGGTKHPFNKSGLPNGRL